MRCPNLAELPPPPPGKTGWPWTVESPQLPDAMPDGKPWPRISIVTPSYNQGQFIEETIRSILLQGYPDLEYIIIDGASTDQSVEIIRKYEAWLTYWISEKDRGQSHAINKGFERAAGSIMNWLNSDDFLAVNALKEIVEAFDMASKDVGAVVGISHKIDNQYHPFYSPLPEKIDRASMIDWIYGGCFMQPACFFRRSAWLECGPIEEHLHYCMDFVLWLAISRRYKFNTLKKTVAYAHAHAGAKTTAERPRMFAEIAVALAREPDGFPTAQRIAMDLVDDKLLSHEPSFDQLVTLLGRKVLRRTKALLSKAGQGSAAPRRLS